MTVKPPPDGAAGPRRKGTPTLGVLASSQAWRAPVSGELEIALTVSNGGGPLEGVLIELGGAALEKDLVVPRSISGKGGDASPFERKGGVATASLPALKLAADLDVDRKIDRMAPRAPALSLTLTLQAARAGSGLLTVRVIPSGRKDRTGSAMVGRTFVVEG